MFRSALRQFAPVVTRSTICRNYAAALKLKDQVALVTGAGSGIGEGIAVKYAQEGAKVAVADLNLNAAQRVVDLIKAAGGEAFPVAMDVTSEEQVNNGVKAIVAKYGGLDVLVSNAGIQHIEPVDKVSFANWRKVVSVHLDASFLCTQAALSVMYPQKRGSIIYIGSVHSKLASALKAPYVSAKHGIMGLCRAVAKEGAAHNVKANVVCPGFVLTPLVEKQIPEQAAHFGISNEEVIKKIFLKDTVDYEFTNVEDIAEVALFFAAFPNKALTGQSLIASHGWVME